jgi:hypothetical protein
LLITNLELMLKKTKYNDFEYKKIENIQLCSLDLWATLGVGRPTGQPKNGHILSIGSRFNV